MEFVWFFLTVYLITSLMNYVLHGPTILDDLLEVIHGENIFKYGTFRKVVGDFAVRALYIFAIYYTFTQFMESY